MLQIHTISPETGLLDSYICRGGRQWYRTGWSYEHRLMYLPGAFLVASNN